MQFNPTKDYYGIDLSVEMNRVKWNFWELIKTLVTLSNSAQNQKEIIGYGAVADEMAVDFESYFTLNSQTYLEHKLLTESQLSKLNSLDEYFDERGGDKMPEFWDDDLLDSHPDWNKVRKMAKEVLTDFGYDNLTIEIERISMKSKSNKNESLTIETTKTRLKKKSVSEQTK